jgi:hypothetical protein
MTCLIVVGWLAYAQPGTSHYWLIDPAVHAQVDAELYGQLPDGETLPGRTPEPPHEHSINQGVGVSGLTLTNPFDAVFYRTLLSPAQQLALSGCPLETGVFVSSVTLTPPDQPPRCAS